MNQLRLRPKEMTLATIAAITTPEPNTGCWLWLKALNSEGYGHIGRKKVHRLVLELSLGRQLGLAEVARHACDQPSCCNPDHLLPGTQQDNIADAVRRRRWACRPGRCTHGQKLTEEDVLAMRSAWRAGSNTYELATRFGVAARSVSSVVRGRAWGHVPGAVTEFDGRSRDSQRRSAAARRAS